MTAENESKRGAALNAEEDLGGAESRIDPMELFFRLLEKAWLIILIGVVAAVAAGLYTHYFVDDTFMATTKLYVIGDDTAIDLTQLNFGDKLAEDYVQVFYNRDVHQAVSESLRSQYGYELPGFDAMQRRLTVKQLTDTRILSISFTDTSKEMALRVVEEYAGAATEFIQDVMGAPVPPAMFETPYAADKPVGPGMARNVALGMALGMFATIAVLVLLFVIDDRIRTADQLERRLGLPTLGMMPVQKKEIRNRRKGEKA